MPRCQSKKIKISDPQEVRVGCTCLQKRGDGIRGNATVWIRDETLKVHITSNDIRRVDQGVIGKGASGGELERGLWGRKE
jgi:hypothetical protein